MSRLKDAFAKAWAKDIAARWPGNTVVPNRRDGDIALPCTVVVVKRLTQTTPGSDVWTAEVRIVHVSDVADTLSDAHAKRVGELRARIEGTPRGVDVTNGVALYGFCLEEVADANGQGPDGRKVTSDVFILQAGVGSTSG